MASLNATSSQVILKLLGHEFTPLVILNCLDPTPLLVLSPCLVLLERSEGLRLGLEPQDRSERCVVVYKDHPVVVALPRATGELVEVHVDELERF